jgi:hypothetical protein
MIQNISWVYNDGGREAAGYKGAAGDCVVRAIAIATGKSYQEVYNAITVIDGVVNDTFDPSREGTRCVYGYYKI